MGNPDQAGHSANQQPQEYDIQPQEYQYEATHDQNIGIRDEYSASTYEASNYVEENEQNQFQAQPNDPQPPLGTRQQQPTQFPPPQANHQAFGAQPASPRPMQQNNQTFPNGPSRPAPYPPQRPQTTPAMPVQFPPPSPQNNPMYSSAYPSQITTQHAYFSPASPHKSPVYPTGPNPMPAQATPMIYPQTVAQMPPTVGYQAPPATRFQNNGMQGQYVGVQNVPVSGIPVPSPGPKPMQASWSSGLFDCMNDPLNALITAFFPCLTFGQLAEIVDEGHTSCGTSGMIYGGIAFCIAMPCIMSCTYRTKLRYKFSLPEAPAPDWVTHFLCECCALCQEYRELQSRGWDPSIGWQGNIARNRNMQFQQATMMPPMNQRMMG